MKKTVLLLTFLLSIVFSISTFAFNYEKKTKSFINLAYAPPPATSVNISGSEFTIDENVKIKFNKAPASSQFAYMYPMFYMSSDKVALYPESSIELIGTSDDVVFSKVFFGYSTPLTTKYSRFTSNEGTIVTTEGSSPAMNWHGRTQNLRLTLDKGPYNFSDITNWRISMSSIYVEYFKLDGTEGRIILNPEEIVLETSDKCILQASVAGMTDFNEPIEPLEWHSDNPSVAKVYSDGTVEAMSGGQATITASFYKATSTGCIVRVTNPEITLSTKQVTLYPEDTHKLEATLNVPGNLVFNSSDTNIVEVDSEGNMRAVNPGTATISAIYKSAIAKCEVTVLKPERPDTFEYNGLIYTILNEADKTCKIKTYAGSNVTGNIVIPEKAYYEAEYYDKEAFTVISIGDDAFSGCSGLTGISIPNSVTSIGSRAFYNCRGLREVIIPKSVTSVGSEAFYGCGFAKTAYPNTISNPFTNGRNVSYPAEGTIVEDGIIYNVEKTIIYYASYGISGSFTIPNSVTSIGVDAFSYCKSLTSVNIPNSVTSIGECAFSSCYGLTSVDIPNSVTSIGEYAFSNCYDLTSVDISNSLTEISGYAFSFCSSLTSVDIPNSVTSIGEYAFCKCSSLTSVYIPNSVTSIGKFAFTRCDGLTSLDIPNSVTSIGEYAFFYCTGLTSIKLSNSVTEIKECTFSYCSSLPRFNIPYSVTSVGNQAFEGCSGLTSVSIPNSVTSIGDYAFKGCSGLTSVKLGNSLETLGTETFALCTGVTEIYSYSTVPPKCGRLSLYDINKETCILVVPVESMAEYMAAYQWEDFKHITAEVSDGDEFEYKGIIYKILSAVDKTCETKRGEGSVAGNNVKGTLVIPETVYNYILPYTVVQLGDRSFYGCTGLTYIDIPNSVTSIGKYAFEQCLSLTRVKMPNSVTEIGDYAFNNCYRLTNIDVPNSVTSIGESAFGKCLSLTRVNIPDSVTEIGKAAFYNCSSLTSVDIPNSVTSIRDNTFASCSALTCVKLGNSLESLCYKAFGDCENITELYSYSEIPPVCGGYAFYGIDKETCILYVPVQSLGKYKSANQWKEFYIIKAIIPEVAEIRLDKTEATIKVGDELQLTATVLPEEAAAAGFTWRSSDNSIATVSATGLVKAVSLGTATISVTCGNVTATCTVEVSDDAGIDGVLVDGNDNVEVYTLQGVRLNISTREELSKLTTGFYIVNGKKVFLK